MTASAPGSECGTRGGTGLPTRGGPEHGSGDPCHLGHLSHMGHLGHMGQVGHLSV